MQHVRTDCGGASLGFQPGVTIGLIRPRLIAQKIEEAFNNLLAAGSAKTDRPCDAVVKRDAMVRIPRRQVQHVAGLYCPFPLRAEAAQYFQRGTRHELKVTLGADLPAARTCALHERDVVAVEMGS